MTILDKYRAARERHPGMMLLFRIGDVFECLGQDAIDLQALCGTMLTGAGEDAKSGFPHHSLEPYLRKLLQLASAWRSVRRLRTISLRSRSDRMFRVYALSGCSFDGGGQSECRCLRPMEKSMPKYILMDEFYLKVFVPDRLEPTESRAIRRVLSSKTFQTVLGRALRALVSHYPSLAKTRIKIAA